MLKLGTWRRDKFTERRPVGFWRRIVHAVSSSRVSLDLLRMPNTPSEEDVAVFERLMPYVRLSSGVYRTTHRARFRNLDPVVNAILAESFDPKLELLVEDWAASDCFTSFEWAQSLFPLFPVARIAASDTLLFLMEAENTKSGEQFVFEPNGKLLQYIRPPFVIRMEPPEPWLLPLNRLVYTVATRRWKAISRFSNELEQRADAAGDYQNRNGYSLRRLPLVHPEAVRLAQADPRFAIRRHSVFDKRNERCHVIRLMNILNRAYFPEERLYRGCRNAVETLEEGGFCIIGRTVSEGPLTHDATIFRKLKSSELEVIRRIGSGSEIESIALAAGRSQG